MHHRQGPSMAKIRVEVDLLKSLPQSVWVGLEDDKSPPSKGLCSKIGVPKHCRKIGHYMVDCRPLERINAVPKIVIQDNEQHIVEAEEKQPNPKELDTNVEMAEKEDNSYNKAGQSSQKGRKHQ
uniref:Putative ovule protein n=1 Tax=Solanum chacoense TaxID=4108 RepID=A0A0V0INU0_SOLCH